MGKDSKTRNKDNVRLPRTVTPPKEKNAGVDPVKQPRPTKPTKEK